MKTENSVGVSHSSWTLNHDVFFAWVEEKAAFFSHGLAPEPTIKVLIFLALLETEKPCTYQAIHHILLQKGVIQGDLPHNTLRTSVLMLGKTLEKCGYPLGLKTYRGIFKLEKRTNPLPEPIEARLSLDTRRERMKGVVSSEDLTDPVVLLDKPSFKAQEEIACILIQKAVLPFKALCLLEWAARRWQHYSAYETECRALYEVGALDKLGIIDRLSQCDSKNCFSVVGLATGEGLAEIDSLKTILQNPHVKVVHYLAIEYSPRLLREHIGLLRETLASEVEAGRLLCAGVIGDIFSELKESVERARQAFLARGLIASPDDFLPKNSGLLVTYLGNCLGNNFPDQETEIFSLVQSVFQNRPLEFLVGVSVMRSTPDEYKRTWDAFLLQTPKHLLETKKLIESSRSSDSHERPEFALPEEDAADEQYPAVRPEYYAVKHGIGGQIYRFYYKTGFSLKLADYLGKDLQPLPKGSMILLLNVIKYNMASLVEGVQKGGAFKIAYNADYHTVIETDRGGREYAVFSAYLEEGTID